ncbi:hypothetical protein ACFXTO_026039 [Malus domestica]
MEQGEGNLQRLLKWASEIGISDSTSCQASCLGHSLAVSFFPDSGGRGLGAARDLTEGELILKVPKSALMTSTSLAMKDDKLSRALNAHHSLSPTQILAVCLLYEMGKGKSSWWHPYLVNLPHSYDILATFGEFEKQALQVDDAKWAAEKATLKAEDDWKEANALMEQLKLKPQLRTFQAWLWASATISSRTLHIPWDAAGCLCPVGDLFNYSAPGEEPSACESMEHATLDLVNDDSSGTLDVDVSDSRRLTDGGFEKDIDAYCFYAKKSYKKGEQALLSYGTYTNLELLEHYGFLLNGNPNDKVFIPLEPEIYSSCSWPKESLYIHQTGKPSFALLSALRLWATPRNQRRSVGHLVYSGLQLSIQNEMYVMTWISKKCNAILKSLPTSFEDDRLLSSAIDKIQNLESPLELYQLSSTCRDEICAFKSNVVQKGERSSMQSRERWRLAVEWRLGYKKILVDCISYCDETCQISTVIWEGSGVRFLILLRTEKLKAKMGMEKWVC